MKFKGLDIGSNMNGLGHIKNVWDFENNQFLATTEIGRRFKLDHGECRIIDTMKRSIHNQWKTLIQQSKDQAPNGSWVGCFEDNM